MTKGQEISDRSVFQIRQNENFGDVSICFWSALVYSVGDDFDDGLFYSKKFISSEMLILKSLLGSGIMN